MENSPTLLLSLLGGMAIGAGVAWALRRRMPRPLNGALGMLGYYGGSLLVGGLLLSGCVLLSGGGDAVLAATRTPTPTKPIPTNTPVPARPSPTVQVRATDTETPTPTPELPSSFTLLLVFGADTACGGTGGFEYDYAVTLTADSITMVQVVNGITSTGPYDPATGAFTAEATGLPGTEVFTGTVSLNGGVTMEGDYTYIDGSSATCDAVFPFSGEYSP
ncbi:MAG: hypothetical protein HYZ26_08815 [Chloroflexi bacterium]|nr:hypothetical protein [Chloroflexota bacterium]